jgi:uncharacterized protein (TIGR03084 family)
MLQQITDFHDEGQELRELLLTLSDADWDRKTLFKDWTINDVVLHLHASDINAAATVRDTAEYEALRRDIQEKRKGGMSMIAESRQRYPGLRGKALLARWWEQLDALCAQLAAKDPAARLVWVGPTMGVKMFATARQMETWAHGQELYDVMGKERVFHDRLRNVAEIGVRTFGWTFANRKLPPPGEVPYVRLVAPSGAIWEWNAPSAENAVQGNGVEFCQVVTQTRNIGDTSLRVVGAPARQWMALAQCFGGPPNDPPAKGARHPATAS